MSSREGTQLAPSPWSRSESRLSAPPCALPTPVPSRGGARGRLTKGRKRLSSAPFRSPGEQRPKRSAS
eukprot:14264229-Alexandrium_andersonii.AAC.1